jgi:tRNA nucleotidyltransferase (CCA-adding enzyme)
VLRGAQFAARFEFDIADETVELCRKMDISTLAKERVMGETEKALLKAEKPSIYFELLRKMGHLSVWFPELEALIGVEQNKKYHTEGDVWVHTMMVLDQAAILREYSGDEHSFMLSALVHDFGKAVCTELIDGELHSYDHERQGLPLVESFISRLTNEVKLKKYLLNMTELHMKPNVLASVNASVKSTNRMLDSSVDPKGLICLAIADGLGKISPLEYVSHNAFFEERYSIYQEYMSRPYVMGSDLIASGLKPSKEFSDYLAYAHKLRLAGVEKESALKQTLAYARKKM